MGHSDGEHALEHYHVHSKGEGKEGKTHYKDGIPVELRTQKRGNGCSLNADNTTLTF